MADKSGIIHAMNTQDTEEITLPCKDKVAFEARKEAEAAGLAADWQYGATLKAYKCRFCELWHLATKYNQE